MASTSPPRMNSRATLIQARLRPTIRLSSSSVKELRTTVAVARWGLSERPSPAYPRPRNKSS